MPHKSKPKQRTNWKQRALHCEEVIRVQNELARAREQKISDQATVILNMSDGAETLRKDRAEANRHAAIAQADYEKVLAEALEWRDRSGAKVICSICGRFCDTTLNRESFCSVKCLRTCVEREPKKPNPPTHWQRFKSWLSGWYVELACLIVILCVTAGCVAFVYWPRG